MCVCACVHVCIVVEKRESESGGKEGEEKETGREIEREQDDTLGRM